MSLPIVAIVPGHGVDVQAWLQQVELPGAFDWQIVHDAATVDVHRWAGIVWLWQPQGSPQTLKAERTGLTQWCRSLVRSRGNNLLPIIVIATENLQRLDEQDKQNCMDWLRSIHFMIKNTYRHLLKGWVPGSLIDPHRITMQASTSEGGARLVDLLNRQMTSVSLWRQGIHRQGERCLALGLVLAFAYLVILLMTVPWYPQARQLKLSREPVKWSRAEWQYHIKDCQQLLQSLHGRSFDKLTIPEQQRFVDHLRWLPISYDLLAQRRSTREVIRIRGQVQELLQQMESLVDTWTAAQPDSMIDQWAHQAMVKQLLDGVFEPRQPPTVLHTAARRYWVGERAATLDLLKSMWGRPIPLPQKQAEMAGALKERLQACETCRVHAPELKTAWLQELSVAHSWLEGSLSKPGSSTEEDMKKETAPGLLREITSAVK